jgi:hypothetical protein
MEDTVVVGSQLLLIVDMTAWPIIIIKRHVENVALQDGSYRDVFLHQDGQVLQKQEA